jgi:hypothetical protein
LILEEVGDDAETRDRSGRHGVVGSRSARSLGG